MAQYEKSALEDTYEADESPKEQVKKDMFDNKPKSGAPTLKSWMEDKIKERESRFLDPATREREIQDAVHDYRVKYRGKERTKTGKFKTYHAPVGHEAIVQNAVSWFGDMVDPLITRRYAALPLREQLVRMGGEVGISRRWEKAETSKLRRWTGRYRGKRDTYAKFTKRNRLARTPKAVRAKIRRIRKK